ncbi:uncharacterized protein PITG_06307 [Phytophthora infestans T30-4]|uniref:Uncharacterized protein n=1 Tax=Phytophthora infestans (strain T30-4) TaxID=403677 RepID=D0N4K1_PHYIT|nr:uncharacterized protein PITG_06307 [Phytophthora infestans T30-4]EEY69809.1 hypothetical protein PITG_06307 [Phytophthora infestans T30-4]|eukprot:XP_002998456.1 hypothetical protein PITG_06307 [Phytophthora infestans T30-4]
MAFHQLVEQSRLCSTETRDPETPRPPQGRAASSTHFRIADNSAASSLNACSSCGDKTPPNRSEARICICFTDNLVPKPRPELGMGFSASAF